MATTTALSVVGKTPGEISPSQLVAALSHQDKATIMSLCMPKGATDSELAMYLYRCKELGFDPLSKELVLQKRTSQDGSVNLSFITTRDALLRKAESNPNYTGINSGVVREGDTFLVDTEKSVVQHTFGTKRGKILAGWAVVYHKTRLPVVAVVDYLEYSNANSSSPVWRSLPSAMIQKVAEVAALRRQFPVLAQGIYTAEEIETEFTPVTVVEPGPEISVPSPLTIPVNQASEEANQEATSEPDAAAEPLVQSPEAASVVTPEDNPTKDAYKLLALQTGKSGTGTPYAKIACELNGTKFVLLAKGEEGLAEAGKLREGCIFKAETVEDKGFTFVRKITVM